MGMFSQGYDASREEQKRQDKVRESFGKKLTRFYIKSGDKREPIIHFLTEEPVCFREHTIPTTRGGKEYYDNILCTKKDCPRCEGGDRPSFKGAFLIIDNTPYETTDKNSGKKKIVERSIRMLVRGQRDLSQLDRLSSKYGLVGRSYTVVRVGTGKSNTSYTYECGDKCSITEEEVRSLFPEKLRSLFDGSIESLHEIIKAQLQMTLGADEGGDAEGAEDNDEAEDGEDEVEAEKQRRGTLVGADRIAPPVKSEQPRKPSVLGFKKKT